MDKVLTEEDNIINYYNAKEFDINCVFPNQEQWVEFFNNSQKFINIAKEKGYNLNFMGNNPYIGGLIMDNINMEDFVDSWFTNFEE